MSADAESAADVFGQHANVRALGNQTLHSEGAVGKIRNGELVNRYAARFALYDLASASERIEALAVLFEC